MLVTIFTCRGHGFIEYMGWISNIRADATRTRCVATKERGKPRVSRACRVCSTPREGIVKQAHSRVHTRCHSGGTRLTLLSCSTSRLMRSLKDPWTATQSTTQTFIADFFTLPQAPSSPSAPLPLQSQFLVSCSPRRPTLRGVSLMMVRCQMSPPVGLPFLVVISRLSPGGRATARGSTHDAT